MNHFTKLVISFIIAIVGTGIVCNFLNFENKTHIILFIFLLSTIIGLYLTINLAINLSFTIFYIISSNKLYAIKLGLFFFPTFESIYGSNYINKVENDTKLLTHYRNYWFKRRTYTFPQLNIISNKRAKSIFKN